MVNLSLSLLILILKSFVNTGLLSYLEAVNIWHITNDRSVLIGRIVSKYNRLLLQTYNDH